MVAVPAMARTVDARRGGNSCAVLLRGALAKIDGRALS
jgi:hypothetical protein